MLINNNVDKKIVPFAHLFQHLAVLARVSHRHCYNFFNCSLILVRESVSDDFRQILFIVGVIVIVGVCVRVQLAPRALLLGTLSRNFSLLN